MCTSRAPCNAHLHGCFSADDLLLASALLGLQSSECIQLHNLGLWLCMSCIAVEWADALIPHAQLCSHMHQLFMVVQAYMLHLCVVLSLSQHGDRSLNMEVGHHVYCNER